MARAAVFIDAAYLNFTLRDEFGSPKIDHEKLAVRLTPPGLELLRTYYYCCPPYQSNPPTQDERDRKASFDRFEAALRGLPRYEVRLGVLAYRGKDQDGKPVFEQKRVDILLGVDLVRLAAKGQITDAVLLAGDSDFLPAVATAKNDGVLIRLFHGRAPHQALIQASDERTRIDQTFIDAIKR